MAEDFLPEDDALALLGRERDFLLRGFVALDTSLWSRPALLLPLLQVSRRAPFFLRLIRDMVTFAPVRPATGCGHAEFTKTAAGCGGRLWFGKDFGSWPWRCRDCEFGTESTFGMVPTSSYVKLVLDSIFDL